MPDTNRSAGTATPARHEVTVWTCELCASVYSKPGFCVQHKGPVTKFPLTGPHVLYRASAVKPLWLAANAAGQTDGDARDQCRTATREFPVPDDWTPRG